MARPSVNILTQYSYFIFGAGDDEHSDYFHEGGSGCDLVNTMLSTSDDVARPNGAVDPSLDAILRGSFQHMSDDAKCNFKARLNAMMKVGSHCNVTRFRTTQWETVAILFQPGREIKMGRRRLPHRVPVRL